MPNLSLSQIQSGYNLSKINENFNKIESFINTYPLHKTEGKNILGQDLDFNSNNILNANKAYLSKLYLNGNLITQGTVTTLEGNRVFPSLSSALNADDLQLGENLVTLSWNAEIMQYWEVVSNTGTEILGEYMDCTDVNFQLRQVFYNNRITPLHFGAYGDCQPIVDITTTYSDSSSDDTVSVNTFFRFITYSNKPFHKYSLGGLYYGVSDSINFVQWFNIILDGEGGGLYALKTFPVDEYLILNYYEAGDPLYPAPPSNSETLTGFYLQRSKFENVTLFCQNIANGFRVGANYLFLTVYNNTVLDYKSFGINDGNTFAHELIVDCNNLRTSSTTATGINVVSNDSIVTTNVVKGGLYGANIHNTANQIVGNHFYGSLINLRCGKNQQIVTNNYFDSGVVILEDPSLTTFSNNFFLASNIGTLKSSGYLGAIIINLQGSNIAAPIDFTCTNNVCRMYNSSDAYDKFKFIHVHYTNNATSPEAVLRSSNTFSGNKLAGTMTYGDITEHETSGKALINSLDIGEVRTVSGSGRFTTRFKEEVKFNLRLKDKTIKPLIITDTLTTGFELSVLDSNVTCSHTFAVSETAEDAIDTWIAAIDAEVVLNPSISSVISYEKKLTGNDAHLCFTLLVNDQNFYLNSKDNTIVSALPRTDSAGISDGGSILFDNRFNYLGEYPVAFDFTSSNNVDAVEANILPAISKFKILKDGSVQPTSNYRASDGTEGYTGNIASGTLVVKNGLIVGVV